MRSGGRAEGVIIFQLESAAGESSTI